MNYLAHAVLAGPDPDWVLGGFLGDHVRGRGWRKWSRPVAAGILLHRRIDSFVDGHPAFRRARARLDPEFRRYAGILLDMYFDHRLARQWPEPGGMALRPFADRQYALLRRHRARLPDSLARFARHMESNDLLAGYARPEVLGAALCGIGRRLSRDNPLDRGLDALQGAECGLARDFDALWPALSAFAAGLRGRPRVLFETTAQGDQRSSKSSTRGS